MKDNTNLNPTPLNHQDQNGNHRSFNGSGSNGRNPMNAASPQTPVNGNGQAKTSRIDAWFVLDLLVQRWHWLVLGSCISGSCFYLLGWFHILPKYTAAAKLLRYESPGKSEFFKTAPVSADTFAAVIRAPELMRSVGERVFPTVPGETFNKWMKIDPDPDSDVVNVYLAARDPQKAVDLLNLYLTNAVEYTRQQEGRQLQFLANSYL